MGDIQQAIITIAFVIFLLGYFLIKDEKSILNRKFILNLVEMSVLIFIVGAVFFIPIIHSLLHSTALADANTASLVGNALWSNNLLSFFLPSPYNGLFTPLADKYYVGMYYGYVEGVSYIGYTVLVLSILGLLYYKQKPKGSGNLKIWLWLMIFFGWLSTGPLLSIYPFGLIPIPGIYLLYHYIPLFNLVREPGRFDLFVTIGLAILAGFGITTLFEKAKTHQKSSTNWKLYITLLITILILIEYNGIPLGSSVSTLFTNSTIPSAYSFIGTIKGNYSVLMLPYPNIPMVMYFQTEFKKPIIGAYTARVNATQISSVNAVPLFEIAANTTILNRVSYTSPIIENASITTLHVLSKYNVSIVGVINGAYNSTARTTLINYLTYLFGPPIYQSNSTTLFSTTNALSKSTR